MKYLFDMESDIGQKGVSLEVYECDCGFHIGLDATYLDQVGSIMTTCPSCEALMHVMVED